MSFHNQFPPPQKHFFSTSPMMNMPSRDKMKLKVLKKFFENKNRKDYISKLYLIIEVKFIFLEYHPMLFIKRSLEK